jgi:hypothetical protein
MIALTVFCVGCLDDFSSNTPTQLTTSPVPHQITVTTTSTQYLETGITTRSYPYILRGKSDIININLYSGVYDYVKQLQIKSPIDGYDYDRQMMNNPIENKYLNSLIDAIKDKTTNKEDQARIAISLVQRIPYDYGRAKLIPISSNIKIPRPYEVLFNDIGVCQDKSYLLAYILRELGFGVAVLYFSDEKHDAVGIKVSSQFDFQDSGYAYLEASNPAIPSVVNPILKSKAYIRKISDGISFDISEEYNDAIKITASKTDMIAICQKYGFKCEVV